MTRIKIKEIFKKSTDLLGQEVTVKGWVRTVRSQKNFSFIEVNDGSILSKLQVVLNNSCPDNLTTGASIAVTGLITKSPGVKQPVELHAYNLTLIGLADPESYPLQKKRHSFEFLRTISHLRPRTNTQGAVARIRNALAYSTHRFFQERGFLYVHTPIITASDCEGAGQMFRVSTLPAGEKNFSKDFFGKETYLTVSGQLNGEAFATALSDIYTFGPTFRAENSNTSRHLAEFWMIEPEMAFADLKDNMDIAESYLKFTLQHLLEEHMEDLKFFDEFIEKGLINRLENVVSHDFARLTYTEAIDILKCSSRIFEFPVEWGTDLQSEHERYLAEEHFKKPVILTDYPKDIKSFYMRQNTDGKTVAAMDILVPKIGEIIGGSQREERLDVLQNRLHESNLSEESYWWYLDLRLFGSVPHAGFGAGFERLVLFATGMENIRDIIPFPRSPGHADF